MSRVLPIVVRDRERRERTVSSLVGLTFAGVWLVFLAEPIGAAWALRGTPRGSAGLVATIAFAALYLWHFQRSRVFAFGSSTQAPRLPTGRLPRYAGLAALGMADTLLVGQTGTNTWVFLAVAGLWTMPVRWAFVVGFTLVAAYETLVRVVDGWSRHTGVSMSIALSMFAVGGGMLAARRSRDLSEVRQENARLAVEEERNRLARDIHDILGHSLTVITVKAELAGRLLDVDVERAGSELASLESLAREALADVRGAVVGVRDISLAGELARARRALTSAGIEARLPTAVDEVRPELKELFAWTVREAVTNVVRHSHADSCEILVEPTAIRVRDDGPGDGPGEGQGYRPVGMGHGLRGLRERASAAGAMVTTRRLQPRGFEVVVAAKAR
ncbi:MAG: histidine kinase [Tetrasphaera sp.]